MTVKKTTLVDKLVARLTKDILSNFFTAGEQLPPIRTLAKTYDVTVPTVQRAIARLEELGLLSVRHGSGMTVLDPLTHANLMVLPYWVDALDAADGVKTILNDFLELRRTVVIEQCVALSQDSPESWSTLEDAVNAFDALGTARRTSISELGQADLGIIRVLMQARQQVAYSMIFNVYQRLLDQNSELQVALFADPQASVKGWRQVVEVLTSGQDANSVRQQLSAQFEQQDIDALERLD